MSATSAGDEQVDLYVGEELLGRLGAVAPVLAADGPAQLIGVVLPGLRFAPVRVVVKVPSRLAWRMRAASWLYRVQAIVGLVAGLTAVIAYAVGGIGVVNHSQTLAGTSFMVAISVTMLFGVAALAAAILTVRQHPRYEIPPGMKATKPKWVLFRGIVKSDDLAEFVRRHGDRALLTPPGSQTRGSEPHPI